MVNYDVLDINNVFNGQDPDISLTDRGSKWLWAVCAIFSAASLGFMALSFMRPRPKRLWHYMTALICFIMAITYFTMASHLGWTTIEPQYKRRNPKVAGFLREIYYVRYIGWFVTKPLILLVVLLTAAVPWHTVLSTILLSMIFVVCRLAGALTRTSYKWGFYAFALAALFAILYKLLAVGPKHSKPLGADINKSYMMLAGWIALTWLLYPLAWGLCEGGNVLAIDSEMIFYGVIDLLDKVVFGLLVHLAHAKIDPARLGLHLRNFDDVVTPSGRYLGEKHHNGVTGTPGTTTGDHV